MTSRSLTSLDRDRITQLQQVMTSPLEYADADEWRRVIARRMLTLMDADKVTVILPIDGRYSGFSNEVSPSDIAAFPTQVLPLDVRWSMWERVTQLGVWSGRTVWGPWYAEYLATPYHNEFLMPRGYLDSMGIATTVGDRRTRSTADSTAGIWLHHADETGPRFGARGERILRALLPAWQAGVQVWKHVERIRASWTSVIDASGAPLVLVSADAHTVHRTPAVHTMLRADPDAGVVEAAIDEVSRVLLASHGMQTSHAQVHGTPTRDVSTRTAQYRIHGATAGRDLDALGVHVLITVERLSMRPPSTDEVIRAFGLTAAQADVALRIAAGSDYERIANERGTSVHTARRLAEQVRRRLGAHSRAEVGAMLARMVR